MKIQNGSCKVHNINLEYRGVVWDVFAVGRSNLGHVLA